jgi:pentapeptide MXKDX repeat protein
MTESINNYKRIVLESPFVDKTNIRYGLVIYSTSLQKFLLHLPIHTLEFLIYIKGEIRPSSLPFLLNYISPCEADLLLKAPTTEYNEELFEYFNNTYLATLKLPSSVQIKKGQIKKDQIKKDQIKKDQIKKRQIKKDQIKKDQIKKGQIKKGQIKKDQIKKDQIKNGLPVLNLIWSDKDNIEYAYSRFKDSIVDAKTFLKSNNVDNLKQRFWTLTFFIPSMKKKTSHSHMFDITVEQFCNEHNVQLPKPLYVSNNYISEVTRFIPGISAEQRYWIYIIKEGDMGVEASEFLKWYSFEECLLVINNKQLLFTIKSIIDNHRLDDS